MNRIFWRHGQAGWGKTDLTRTLTNIGQQQAKESADWLRKQGIDFPIYSSQALRSYETACFYAEPLQQLAGLNPDGALSNVLNDLNTIVHENAIIVGHLPWIGQIIGEMLAIPTGYLPVNTAELYWLQSNDGKQWILKGRFPNA